MKITKLLIFIIILFIISFFSYKYLVGNTGDDINPIEINIPKGTSLKEISVELKDKKLIRSEMIFLLYAKINSFENAKSGNYVFYKSQTVEEILINLNKGTVDLGIKLTIPEGYEIRNIVEKLQKTIEIDSTKFIDLTENPQHLINSYEFLNDNKIKTLEGFLYPDTYYISENATEEEIIKIMLDRFSQIYYEKKIDEYINQKNISLNEFITLASIVEREAVKNEERKIIASVFYNRLKINMPLQSCATVQYILGERKPNLTYEDTKINSPYNTYINFGLPPTPIASPGLESLLATMKPEDTKYLFFVAKGNGEHEFSITYEEHLEAKKKYLGE